MSIFEIIMLLCFGAAWPFSIYNSWKSGSTKGKSVIFLITLMIGYVAGIINKIFYSYDAVIYLYLLNLIMVAIDTALWLRNRRREKMVEQSC
ncbi:hypothetical protein [Candidatus Methanomassiliicoccus intestinalis]|uniref:hypothetical protein n=2 Tax=Candidatus Methanomassiliicoccus intestinalis TaxID=1406512 RepID=UPI0037DC66CC